MECRTRCRNEMRGQLGKESTGLKEGSKRKVSQIEINLK